MLYTANDTLTANSDKTKYDKVKIKDGVLLFDNDTTELKFVSLTGREAIREIRFTVSQPGLKYLDVSRCNVEKIYFSNNCCPQLRSLYLHHNKLSAIEFNTQFPQLQLLDLSFNENLREIIINNASSILPELKYLYLHKCKLGSLQAFARFFTNDDNDFNIEENEELRVPPEAIVKQGKVAIRDYFKQIIQDEEKEEKQQFLYEAKLLVLGDPRAGKTTLARKIVDPSATLPKEDETTRGVELGKWSFHHDFEGMGIQEVTVNIWDFGGQAIYKQAHRFFLTQRSLYILLSDAGASDKTDFPYWLHTTKVFGKDSPVIIVINEKDGRKFTVPFDTLHDINHNLKKHKCVDLKGVATNKKEIPRFNKILDLLKSQLTSLRHLGEPVPSTWKKIRNRISEEEEEGVQLIQSDEYTKICREFGLEDESAQKTLAQYFHDIGVFLFFQDDDLLKRRIFIDKQWILNAAYFVVDSITVEQNKGRLKNDEFIELFDESYQRFMPEIKALLKRFYIIYEKDGYFIVPQKLPEEKQHQWSTDNTISFVFSYDNYMPAGIFWQFIVEVKDHIKNEMVWRYGVILRYDDGTEVFITEKYGEDKITIKVRGTNKVDTRAVIINKIEEINRSYGDLKVNKYIPCICEVCTRLQSEGGEPYFFDYTRLLKAKSNRKLTVECQESWKEISLDKLLEGSDEKIGDPPPPLPWWKIVKIALFFFVLILCTGLYWFFTPYVNDFNWWAIFGGIIIAVIGGYKGLFAIFKDAK